MAKVNRKLVIRVMLNKHSPLSIGHLASFCENRPEFSKQKTDVQRSPAGGKESGVQALPVRKQGGGNQVLERRNPHSCQEEKAGGGQKPELDGQPSGPRRLGERFDPIGDF